MPHRDGERLPLEGGGWVLLKVSPRARRVSIRIDARTGEAVAVAPSARRLADAAAFARSKSGWIAERTQARPQGAPITPGGTILLHGRPVRLEATGNAAAARLSPDGDVIRAGGEGEAFARRVLALLKREAKAALAARTEAHLRALGQGPVRLSIIDPRSRWGSCSPHNRSIRYSWRVVMAPPAVLDYLAAHEAAHLIHADHSPAYWRVVERLVGDPRPHRAWLRQNGAALHAVGR